MPCKLLPTQGLSTSEPARNRAMRRPFVWLSAWTLVILFSAPWPGIAGQDPATPVPFEALRTAVPALSTMSLGSLQEVTVRWRVYSGTADQIGPAPLVNELTAVASRSVPGPFPHQRNPELSSSHLVAIASDAQGQAVGWQIIPDPRLIRAEFPGPNGELSGQVFHRAVTEFLLVLPDRAEIEAIQIVQPRWTGTEFFLESVGTVAMPR